MIPHKVRLWAEFSLLNYCFERVRSDFWNSMSISRYLLRTCMEFIQHDSVIFDIPNSELLICDCRLMYIIVELCLSSWN